LKESSNKSYTISGAKVRIFFEKSNNQVLSFKF